MNKWQHAARWFQVEFTSCLCYYSNCWFLSILNSDNNAELLQGYLQMRCILLQWTFIKLHSNVTFLTSDRRRRLHYFTVTTLFYMYLFTVSFSRRSFYLADHLRKPGYTQSEPNEIIWCKEQREICITVYCIFILSNLIVFGNSESSYKL